MVCFANIKEIKNFIKDGTIPQNNNLVSNSFLYYSDGIFLFDKDKLFNSKVVELSGIRELYDIKLFETIYNKYIPIFEKNTSRELFSNKEFNNFRKKTQGIKSINSDEYEFSDNLYFQGLDEYLTKINENLRTIHEEKNIIMGTLEEAFKEIGYTINAQNDTDFNIEIIDTGSTSRGTNNPNSIPDYDFIIKANIEPEKLERIKSIIINKMKGTNKTLPKEFRIRLDNVYMNGISHPLELDFSFVKKGKYLSSDEVLKEKLQTIYEQDINKYYLVIANIMFAKEFLKRNNCYKAYRSDKSQGGFGGIGVENFILQNGGSFIEAAKNFLEVANNKSFIEFEKEYALLDFGKDHVSVSKDNFPYDNFVMKNMRQDGYEKMKKCLNEFIDYINRINEQDNEYKNGNMNI